MSKTVLVVGDSPTSFIGAGGMQLLGGTKLLKTISTPLDPPPAPALTITDEKGLWFTRRWRLGARRQNSPERAAMLKARRAEQLARIPGQVHRIAYTVKGQKPYIVSPSREAYRQAMKAKKQRVAL